MSHSSSWGENIKPGSSGFSNCNEILIHAPIGIFISTPEGRFLSANLTLAEMLGYDSPATLLATITDIAGQLYFNAEDRKEIKRLLERDGQVVNYQYQMVCKDGSLIWVSHNSRAAKDAAGVIVRYEGFLTNITDRMHAEDEIRKFKTIADQGIHGVAISDLQGNLLYINDYFSKLHGYTREELAGQKFLILHNQEQLPLVEQLIAQLTTKGRFPPTIVWHNHRDGSPFPLLMSGVLINDALGNPGYLAATAIDVTENMRVEAALRESEKRNRLLAEVTLEGIVIHKNGISIDVNTSMAKMLGLPRSKLLNTNFLDFIHVDDRGIVLENMGKDYAAPYFVRVTRADGTFFWAEIEARNFRMEDETWRAAAIRDISERRRMETALREKSDELETYFTMSLDLLCIADTNGTFLRLNPQWEKVLGYTARELVGRSFFELLHPDDLEATRKAVSALESQHEISSFENRYRRSDGTYCWIEWRSKPQGNIIYAAARDITERKRAEEALRLSEETFRNIVESTPMGIFIYRLTEDDRLVLIGANPAANQLLGVDCGRFIGKTIEEAFPPLQETEIPFRYRQAAGSGKSWHTEQIDYSHGDITGAFEVYVFQMSPGKAAVLFNDITERIRAQEALRKSEERLELAMLAANDGLWDWDLANNTVFFDYRYYTMAGYAPNEFPHHFDEWRKRVHPDDIGLCLERLEGHLGKKTEVFDADFRFLRKDDTWMWIRGRGKSVVHDEKGATLRMIGTHADITNRRKAQAEKEKLQEQLTQAQKMESIGRLAGGVAHDFNNMLGVILGHTEIALSKLEPSHPLFANLKDINRAAQRSADLTRQLLAFARKQTVSPRVLDLNSTVEEMLNMLRRLIGEDVELIWLPGSNLQPVKMDTSQLDQILANLCVNARDAITDTGRITIETRAVTLDEQYCTHHRGFNPGQYIQLIVSDDGCGMGPEVLPHLFEPFYTTKEMGKGTGLGLATVYGIVKQNDGFINVYSEPDRGTTFTIYLPPHTTAGEKTMQLETRKPAARGHETILLVEDEPMILDLTTTILKLQGYEVLPASTPGEAIRLAQEHNGQIDMLLTDVVMPEMNGRELARNLLTIYPNLKRLFMSGYTANVIAHHGVLDEGVHFIQKPFTIKDLADKIRKVLD